MKTNPKSTTLQQKFLDPNQGVYFIGTTPPRASTDDKAVEEIADKLLMRLSHLDYDGLIVYDIQDESSRTDKPRPFPFAGTKDPRAYSALLQKKAALQKTPPPQIITYKSVSQRNRADFDRWLEDAWTEFGVRNLVLVGSPSRDATIQLSLPEAYAALAESQRDFALGGVTIAERHAVKGNENKRLISKSEQGCTYFISQAVYDADATISLLQDYAEDCRQRGETPKRIILTFTPCGSQKTVDFMHWLGISVPQETRTRIVNAKAPLSESIKICRANLERILAACLPLGIPLGLNIESLTNRKEEIEASVRLFKLLKATLDAELDAAHPLATAKAV